MGRGRTTRASLAKPAQNGHEAQVTAVILAAGSSRRMGRPKPLIPVGGRPLLARVLETVRRSLVTETIVVLGHAADRIRKAVPLRDVVVVENPDHRRGMSTSLRAGVRAASRAADAYLIVLGDQPFVASETLNTLISSWQSNGPRILIPTFRGRRGNPVLLDRSLAGEICRIRGDVGFRSVFTRHADDIRELPVDDPGVLLDLDTPRQFKALSAGLRSGRPVRAVLEDCTAPESQHRP